MRTTLTIEDSVDKSLREIAHKTGKPYKQVVNETLQAGLAARRVVSKARPYRLKPCALGEVTPGYNLTKALQLAEQIEDEEIVRKMEMKK